PEPVLEFIGRHAGGLPLLVEELLTGMRSAGALTLADGAWTVSAAIEPMVPLTFARTVQQRLAALPADAQQLARAAAVLGAEFDWRLLPAAVESSEQQVLGGLRRLVDEQLVVTGDDGFAFRHNLTREAVLTTALPPERAALAGRLARALDAGDRRDDHQAAAELHALAGDNRSAAARWRAGAIEALGRGALATATRMLARAGALVAEDSPEGLDVRETLLDVLAHAGDSAEAMRVGSRLLADLETQVDSAPDRLAQVRLKLTRAALAGGLLEEAAAFLAGTEEVDPAASAVLRAGVELGSFHLEAASEQAHLALSAAGDQRPGLACEAWEVMGRAARGRDVLEAEEAFEEGLRVAGEHGLGHWRSRMLQELAALDLAGRRPTEERFLAAREAALATGALATAALVELNLNIVRVRYLDLERAMEAADASIEQMTRLRLPMLGPAYLLRAFAQGLAGNGAAMEEDLTRGLEVNPGDLVTIAGAHAHVRAPVALSRGRYEEARAEFARGMEIYRRHPGMAFSMRGLWALLETVLGDGEEAREEVRHGEQATSPHNWFALRYADAVALGRAGRNTEAEQVFADAEWSLPGQEPWLEVHARGLVARGAAADGWGDPTLWFRRTLDGLVDFGQAEAATECRTAMRAAGIPVPRKAQGGRRVPAHLQRLGVSPREYDVFLLVVEGLTNQAIAERLFLSARTVEVHVARLLQRTGSTSRGDLGAHRGEPVG
ncbi:LuxR C-terminal-related transcriptional regulator, partial [Nocardioides sp.]|uniref:LuxR C-terminal-related transcriptional regulator n=1 Tax=Nocardioides sp. TaxID=35761 RepID=UPI002735D2C7